MPLRFENSTVYFESECMVEEALTLVEYLRTHEDVRIDMKDCSYVHTAVLQALAASSPKEVELPFAAQLARWVRAVVTAAETPKYEAQEFHGRDGL